MNWRPSRFWGEPAPDESPWSRGRESSSSSWMAGMSILRFWIGRARASRFGGWKRADGSCGGWRWRFCVWASEPGVRGERVLRTSKVFLRASTHLPAGAGSWATTSASSLSIGNESLCVLAPEPIGVYAGLRNGYGRVSSYACYRR